LANGEKKLCEIPVGIHRIVNRRLPFFRQKFHAGIDELNLLFSFLLSSAVPIIEEMMGFCNYDL
jgi:hypothetical protein